MASTSRTLNRICAAGACAAAVAFLASCTIVRQNAKAGTETAEQKAAANEGFDAAAFVETNWAGRIEPELVQNAVELRDMLAALKKDPDAAQKKFGRRQDETAQYNFMVKGRETIKAVNTESAAGTIELAVPDLSGEGGACVQIGPVVKSTAVRDVLSFIHFGDFTNQLEFANISKSINFHVRDKVAAGIKEKARPGKKLFFVGAFSEDPGGKVLITPVQIRVEE